ncbi:S41 family peptidase [Thermophagus xiamenensis]|uniref:Carboxyl-terminal processing protease n=1 Tax=Thermophagus xiamenensis TaxID=385682 RepID=A0A1I2ENQ2_9BACT|nr:S41 family peptidase [Thermophagus xiamenensis]SFE94217.1 carboxyl-terminal processing protease [Thermophagus xiamenensis]
MTEKRKHTSKQIYFPIVLAIVLVFGMWIGRVTMPSATSESGRRLLLYPQSGKLQSIINLIKEQYVDSIDVDKLEEKVIPEVLKNLDPHSVYIPPKDLQAANQELEGKFGGIGVEFSMQNDTVMVISVVSGGPSEKVGILPGDRIITVNDSVIAGVNMPTNDVVSMLRGDIGTKVNVGIKRKNRENLINFEITRGSIPLYSVDVAYMLDDSIGYIKINRFARNTYQELLGALAKLKAHNCSHVIVDLRGNSGGYLDIAISMVNEFLDKGDMIVYTEGVHSPRQEIHANGSGSCKNTDVTVLIDEFSASASEIFAGAMQDNDRGLVVGRRSFGKGLVQQQFPLPDGGALRLTVARYYTPSGRCIQKPYNNGIEDYYKDILYRYEHGEFFNKDSITVNDSLVYKTVGGRIVYGGGGIMPDVFVGRDTSNFSDYYFNLRESGVIYKFALDYADRNRNELSKYETVDELKAYLDKQPIGDMLVEFATKEKVKFNPAQYQVSKKLIINETKAYIARNILDNEGFYPIIREQDEVLNKALEVIRSGLRDSILHFAAGTMEDGNKQAVAIEQQ